MAEEPAGPAVVDVGGTGSGAPADVEPRTGTLAPLRVRVFRLLFSIHLGTQLAMFVNGLGAAWLLTDLTDSPAVVATLQLAVSGPSFLLAMVAGALADVISRKKIIVWAQGGAMLVAAAFAVIAGTEAHRPGTVLGLTAVLGILTALSAPSWVAVIPGLVPRRTLPGAMTLSSAGMSVAMAMGPALGGLIIAAAGPAWVFALNAVVFGVGLVVLRRWRPEPRTGLPAEHLASAVRLGLRYVRFDRPLKVVIAKIVPFAVTGAALMSLLPAVARFRLGAGPAAFGLLSGAGGIGAVVALVVMPRLRRRLGPDTIVLGSMLVESTVLAVLATTTSAPVAFGALVAGGAATLALVSTVMTALQVVLPAWIRGRGVAVYLFALQGSFAAGAMLWGAVAEQAGLRTALLTAATTMAVAAVITATLRLSRYGDVDTTAVQLIDDPPPVTSVHDDDGPILLTANWRVPAENRAAFVAAMTPVRTALSRKGALGFRLAEDVQRPGHMVESFLVATWSEYQRLPKRATEADRHVQRALRAAAGTDLPGFTAHRVLDLRHSPATTRRRT